MDAGRGRITPSISAARIDASEGRSGAARGSQPGELWAVVLAGGEGVRLRALTRLICGDDRPKQYVPLLGSRTLLEQTLERLARLVPPQRTVIVGHERQASYLAALGIDRSGLTVLLQPENRGTAAAILLATHWTLRRDPEALVGVFPSDHFVLEEGLFTGCVREAAYASRTLGGRMVLLGAHPTDADPEYGWVEPGPPSDRRRGASTPSAASWRSRRLRLRTPAWPPATSGTRSSWWAADA